MRMLSLESSSSRSTESRLPIPVTAVLRPIWEHPLAAREMSAEYARWVVVGGLPSCPQHVDVYAAFGFFRTPPPG